MEHVVPEFLVDEYGAFDGETLRSLAELRLEVCHLREKVVALKARIAELE